MNLPTLSKTFPNMIGISIPAPSYKGKSRKMFPHAMEVGFQILNDTNKFVSIVYYCGKRGYKFNYEDIEVGGIKGFRMNILVNTKRQITYLKKKFG